MKMRLFGAACAISVLSSPAALADPGWSGEGALAAGLTTGNTETTDVGLGLEVEYEGGVYTHHGELAFDYAEQDGLESKNRIFGAYQLDRQLSDRLFGFFRTSYERDEFSGFDNRVFVGVGLGYDVIDNAATTWSVKAAPGLRIDEIASAPATATAPAVVGGTEETFAVVLGSEFEHAFNDAVTLSNNTEILYSEVSTQTSNRIALTAQMTDTLSARMSFEARHESDPPAGREETDTTTRFGLVYGF